MLLSLKRSYGGGARRQVMNEMPCGVDHLGAVLGIVVDKAMAEGC